MWRLGARAQATGGPLLKIESMLMQGDPPPSTYTKSDYF